MSHEFVDTQPYYVNPCQHPEHDPPKYVVIPEGKMMRHTCPECGSVCYVYNMNNFNLQVK